MKHRHPGALMAARVLCFWGRAEALELAPRPAYVLAGEARSRKRHLLSPVKSPHCSLRFRTVPAPAARSTAARAGPVYPGP